MLKHLLEDFKDLDLRLSRLADGDVIGNAYEYMIANFASDAGKKVENFLHLLKCRNFWQGLLNQRKMTEFMTQPAVPDHFLLKPIKKYLQGRHRFTDRKETVKPIFFVE
ncbi:MAG: type restriction enzyme protein [Thermoanaerobacterium sp.]|jgi:type I restriction enzyme M protein|nr:type restriction enzyme protein [Thermoanaerobacterium sp.]